MFKQMVALSSLAGGIAAAALAMYLQYNPLAFTAPSVELQTHLYSAVAHSTPLTPNSMTGVERSARSANAASETSATNGTTNAEPAPTFEDMEVLELPPVVVTRPRRAAFRAAPVSQQLAPAPELNFSAPAEQNMTPVTPRPLRPCSGFRELGPANVDDGVPSGSVGVRDLC
jgi:hypothetical protein